MTSLLIAAQRGAVPADEAIVRSTTAIVSEDSAPAVMDAPPDYNETETDSNPYLGLVSRNLASYVRPTEKYRSPVIDDVNSSGDHFTIVNKQIASSGTAAAREDAGVWGHGTMKEVVGIEPTIRPGTEFGPEFFRTHDRGVQEGVSDYMTAASQADPGTESAAQATSAYGSRTAVQKSQYSAYYDNFLSGI